MNEWMKWSKHTYANLSLLISKDLHHLYELSPPEHVWFSLPWILKNMNLNDFREHINAFVDHRPHPPLLPVLLYSFVLLCIPGSIILNMKFINICIIIVTNTYWVLTWARTCSRHFSYITAFYTIQQPTVKVWCYALHSLVVLASIPNCTVESTKEERLAPTVVHTQKELKV